MLKISRQTELGEHPGFEDEAFSSHGPITEFHATNALPQVLQEGIKPPSYRRSMKYIPEGLRHLMKVPLHERPSISYTTPSEKFAQDFKNKRIEEQGPGTKRNIPKDNFGIVGVRGRDLEQPTLEDDNKNSYVRVGEIPRKYIVRKEAKSPKALAHKRKYETEYESSPARKKYRRELESERRKRGVAGKGGGDMSHTKTGKIVVEDPHTNRARSHPSVGSTLKMVKIVKTEFAPPSEQGDNPAASTLFDPKTGKVGSSVVHGQPGMNPEEATRQVIHEDMHRATLPEVGIENMGHAEFPAMLGEELYLQRLAQEGKPHRKRDPHTLESSDPITQALYRTGKHSDVPKEQQKKYLRTFAERMNPIKVKKMVIVKNFNTCYQCGKTWEQLGLANALPIQRSLHEDRCMGMVTSEKDSMFQQ